MRIRLARRPLAVGLLLAATVSGLVGCRTSPDVAAYVGDSEITVAELESAVDARLEDPEVAAFAEGQEAAFARRVLGFLVEEELYAEVMARYEVDVEDDDVRARIEQLLEGQDADAVYAGLAQQGLGRVDVFENVRQQLVRQQVAEAEGLADGLSEEALRQRYEQRRASLAEVQLGLITVPDQATADAVLAQLEANPRAYRQVAARYPGTFTLPDVQALTPDQLPAQLGETVAATDPGTGFTLPVQQTGGIVVGLVTGTTYPPFEDVRVDLENEASGEVDEAANTVIDGVRDDLDVTVNPRYGVLRDGGIEPGDGGVVDILEDDGGASGGGTLPDTGGQQPTN